MAGFRVSRSLGIQLTESLQIIQGKLVAQEMRRIYWSAQLHVWVSANEGLQKHFTYACLYDKGDYLVKVCRLYSRLTH